MCRSADDPDAQGGPEYEYDNWWADNEAAAAEYRAESEDAIIRENWTIEYY